MLAAIRKFFEVHDFDGLALRLPPNIHSVASQLYLVRHIFPPQESSEYALYQRLLEMMTKNDDARYLSNINSLDDSQMISCWTTFRGSQMATTQAKRHFKTCWLQWSYGARILKQDCKIT